MFYTQTQAWTHTHYFNRCQMWSAFDTQFTLGDANVAFTQRKAEAASTKDHSPPSMAALWPQHWGGTAAYRGAVPMGPWPRGAWKQLREEEAAKICSCPMWADASPAAGRWTQPMERRWKEHFSHTFRKGVSRNWRGCCSIPTSLASPQLQLFLVSPIQSSENRTVGPL